MADNSNLKDLSDQIRTVHLALILVAFVLLAALTQTPPRKVERAISDAETIYGLATTLDSFPSPINDEFDHAVEGYVLHSGNDLQKGEPLNVEFSWPDGRTQKLELTGPLTAAYLSDARYEGEDDIENPAYGYVPTRFRSLGDFIRFWNHNVKEQVVLVPKIGLKDIRNTRTTQGQDAKGVKNLRMLPQTNSPLKSATLHAGVEGEALVFVTYPEAGVPGLTIRVPLVRLSSFNLQTVVRKYAKKEKDWLPGTFAESFPELEERAKNLKTLNLRDLVTELNERANREQDKIEVLGAKIDPTVLTRWGLFLLALCQFYLWLHMDALLRSLPISGDDDPHPPSVWIGLYPGFWARIFAVVSLVVPVMIAVYWLFLQWGTLAWPWFLAACINALVCLMLAIATVSVLVQVRAKIDPTGHTSSAGEARTDDL